jgi:glycosyltransferase involved in cell wall biosynthesis
MNLVMYGGPTGWDDAWYSRHHLTAALARRHRVVLMSDPQPWRDVSRHPRSVFQPSRIVDNGQGTMRYTPPGWLPEVYRPARLRRTLNVVRLRALAGALRRVMDEPVIHYLWHPQYQVAVDDLADSPTVYHCYDRYDHYAGDHTDTLRLERRLVRRAAVCIAASVELGEHLTRQGARDVVVLRHGVDHTLFRHGVLPHPGLRDVPGPRLGVVASLTDAVDVATLADIAGARPDWSLVIVGGTYFASAAKQATFDALCRLPNVHHVGLRPRTEIPSWIAGFDAALACYDLGTWAPFIQPLKMNEYLACGVPVVATDLAATRELGDLVGRATGSEQWISVIDRTLSENGPSHVLRRVAFAQSNGWERRAAELEAVLLRVSGGAAGGQLLTTATSSRTAAR